jgi:hypothetical protein
VLLPAGALMLWRGWWLAASVPQHHTAGASFQAGLVALALGAAVGGEGFATATSAWALGFLAVGLLALSVVRGDEAGARRDPVARLWALGFTAVLLAVAWGMASGGGAIAQALADLGARLLDAFLAALNALFTWLASLTVSPEPVDLPPELAQPPRQTQQNELRELLTIPESVRRVGGIGVMLAFIVPLIVAIVRYLGELWRKLTDPLFMAGVQVETVEGSGWGVSRALRALALRLARLLWRGAGGRALDGDPRGWPVRTAYRDLLRRAAKHGAPRPPEATAAEHVLALVQLFPGHEADLREITRAYERARYGPAPERAQAAEVKERLRRVTRRGWFRR